MRLMYLSTVFLILLITVNCHNSEDDKNGNLKIPLELIATWTFDSACVADSAGAECIPVDLKSLVTFIPNSQLATLTISEDESYIYKQLNKEHKPIVTLRGQIKVRDDRFVLSKVPLINEGTWMVNDNHLTFIVTYESGSVLELYASK